MTDVMTELAAYGNQMDWAFALCAIAGALIAKILG
jgi:ABC-type cobalamin transport system permease subunit